MDPIWDPKCQFCKKRMGDDIWWSLWKLCLIMTKAQVPFTWLSYYYEVATQKRPRKKIQLHFGRAFQRDGRLIFFKGTESWSWMMSMICQPPLWYDSRLQCPSFWWYFRYILCHLPAILFWQDDCLGIIFLLLILESFYLHGEWKCGWDTSGRWNECLYCEPGW